MSDSVEPKQDERDDARAAREALVGTIVTGRYALRKLLGHGGMGAVYEAEHLGLGKRVAIKFVDPEFATDEQVVARFAREARAMSAIESAHIVTIFDAGTEGGRPFLVMELLRGEDLGQRLRRQRRVPEKEALHICAQVLKGLARAHAAGIVHRDLKPDNVFLTKNDTDPLFAKIVDFGVSKIDRPRAGTTPLALTGRGTVLGTPFYMSPEQAQASSDVDGRADLYSVGAILFECLTGRPPHTGESYEQVILSICMTDAPSVRAIEPSLSPELAAFVARALARHKAQRFSTAERMLAALHEIAPEERIRVPLDPPAPKTLLSVGTEPLSQRDDAAVPAVATRLGHAALVVEPPSTKPEGARAKTPATDDKNARAARPSPPPAQRASSPSKRTPVPVEPVPEPTRAPRSKVSLVLTALLATALGIGATFAIITVVEKKPKAEVAPSSTTSVSSSAPVVVPSASERGAGSTSTASVPTATTTAAPPVSVAHPPVPTGNNVVVKPVPSGTHKTKPLDINRELP